MSVCVSNQIINIKSGKILENDCVKQLKKCIEPRTAELHPTETSCEHMTYLRALHWTGLVICVTVLHKNEYNNTQL